MRALGAALNFMELAPPNKEILMTRILISLSILSLLAACEAPNAPATEATPTPTAATEKTPEAKPNAQAKPSAVQAPATTAIAARDRETTAAAKPPASLD